MYKLLLLIPLFLLLNGCSQQTRGVTPHQYSSSHVSPYSLEALDAYYRQGR